MFTTKVILNLSIFVLLLSQFAQAKVCHTGVEGDCPKGQGCYSPKHEPGSPGICGKTCAVGTLNPCAKGQTCKALTSAMGSAGICVVDNLCVEEKKALDDMQGALVDHIHNMYMNVLTSFTKELFHQVINEESSMMRCGGANDTVCASDEFCFYEPGTVESHPEGRCYKYSEDWGFCHTGVDSTCPANEKCIAPHNAPPGAIGWCVPKNAKSCTTGAKTVCPKTQVCAAGPGALPGAPGYCIKENPCWPQTLFFNYIQYWQFQNQRDSYLWDLDLSHQLQLKDMINSHGN